MAFRGTKPKPAGLALIQGRIGAPKLSTPPKIALPPLTSAPPSPLWLPNVHAIAEWNRLAPIMVMHRLLTDANLNELGMLCACFGKIIEGMNDPKRMYAMSSTLLSQYRIMMSEFGLTPSSQARAVPFSGEGGAESNPFLKNQRSA